MGIETLAARIHVRCPEALLQRVLGIFLLNLGKPVYYYQFYRLGTEI